jgi:Domain of unknown function (DUF1824)
MISSDSASSDSASSDSATPTLESALALLKQFDCLDRSSTPNPAEVRAALRQVLQHCDYPIFGICTDTLAAAIAALKTYVSALGYDSVVPDDRTSPGTAVYLKYNPRNGLCYASSYPGDHRGVLVSCQAAYEGDVNEIFGHLPLDLFDV